MQIVDKLHTVAEEVTSNRQYDVISIPDKLLDIDIRINDIIEEYLQLSKQRKSCVDNAITHEIAWILLSFAIRMATYSLRLSSQRFFTNGLQSLGMSIGVLDVREIWVVLVLYSDVHEKIGLSLETVLHQGSDFSSLLRDFIGRNKQEKSLSSMGYVIHIDENNNPTYIRTW